MRLWNFALALVCISIFCCNSGKADEYLPYEDVPQAGSGVGAYENVPYTGTSQNVPYTGTGMGAGTGRGTGAGAGAGTGRGTGVGAGAGAGSGTGIVGDDPSEIVDEALLCFNDKHLYSSCEESYRLTAVGNLDVPPDYVDAYCGGPCLEETNLVLTCIEGIMSHFEFYNKATIQDIRETIKAGCGYGPERGDFNVAEHLQAEESGARKTAAQILSALGFMIAARALLL